MGKILMYNNIQKTAALGEILVREGAITHAMLEAALKEQQECGDRLGQILIGKGYLNNLTLYQAIAQHYALPFADLRQFPADNTLLQESKRAEYLHLGIIPWRIEAGEIVYAVTDISPEIHHWIRAQGVERYQLVITSPMDIAYSVRLYFASHDDEQAREELWRLSPGSSAKTLLAKVKEKCIALMIAGLVGVLLTMGHMALYAFIAMNIFYVLTLLFKTTLFIAGSGKSRKVESARLRDVKSLPVYTILVPMYQEVEILPQLVQAIRNLDYPKSKLDVKLVVEENDLKTIHAIKALGCESYFEMIPVPYSLPQTKPKACNYALKYARGEYLTIYDAEDIPHPAQLRQALAVFDTDASIACVQAKLNYYNREENLLTRMFALEYGVWFDLLLRGLERLKLPIPLGGTSNHIRTAILRELYAWDPYNVTEDADLGVRLAASGYKTRMVDSLTLEESPISVNAWIKQRSRWVKGYMQTWLVYMRHPLLLWRRLGGWGFLGFQFFIGAPCLVFLINPVMWGVSLYTLVDSWQELYTLPPMISFLLWANLLAGGVLHLILVGKVVIRHRWWDMIPYLPCFIPYFALHSLASIKALWQLVFKPHWWEKTTHGLSKYSILSTHNPREGQGKA